MPDQLLLSPSEEFTIRNRLYVGAPAARRPYFIRDYFEKRILIGAFSWVRDTAFEVEVRLRPGATKDTFLREIEAAVDALLKEIRAEEALLKTP